MQLYNRANKEYHMLSRKLCLLDETLTRTIIHLEIYQKILLHDLLVVTTNTIAKFQSILIILLMCMPIFIYTQTQTNEDSLFIKLNKNVVFHKSTSSEIIWERIAIPEGKELISFKVTPNNDLYIGCDFGGVYKYHYGEWELIGLDNKTVSEFETNNDELLIVADGIYNWDGNELVFISNKYCNPLKKTYDYFFGAAYFDVVRSMDNCSSWETVYELEGTAEVIKAFASTSVDSIFMGTTNWVGLGGGIYLSPDGGDTWNNFGLSNNFIACLSVDNINQVYAGNTGHYITGQGGLYRYNYETEIWDTLHYFPYITSIVFNTENHIYTGFITSGSEDSGGVLHSEDNGVTWILDTTGIGNTMVNELQIGNNGFLYALTGYTTKKLYRTTLPVNILENQESNIKTLKCFPNPANNYISVAFKPNYKNSNQLFLDVFNTIGQTLFKKKLTVAEMEKGNVLLDISNLKVGFYVIRITGNRFCALNKFSKQ